MCYTYNAHIKYGKVSLKIVQFKSEDLCHKLFDFGQVIKPL